MVGLTRFLFLMNLCEKNGVPTNIYSGFMLFKKDANFQGVKKLFVLQEVKAVSGSAVRREIFEVREFDFFL
jgi:hypothetical protein